MAAEPGRREHAAVNRFLKRQLQEPLDQRLDVTAQAQRAEIATEALREVKTKSLVLDNARRERSKQVVKEAAERKILTRLHRARQPHARRRKALSNALQACSRDEDFEGLRQAIHIKAGGNLAKPLRGTVIYVSEDVFYLLRSGRSGRVHRIPLRKTQAQFQAPLDRLGVFWTDAAQLVKAEL
ncbi:Hypothetical Protein FCC1311_074732 [Hondaea fermentalgiana]|uniref:Uncharacterized protein n=1 Tax=Hondaea fermentalgiana TaxID=2315210 RepID=A0A2R5GK22_9STRA|nr:Hypothetical Protein FCC1311_074732 [Hondaea fermentalgiana]|eukprot:GBG31252.1 Hypothetical Protein FCC1311_074732 [Hondaea fermentalgiana]